ncbi:hypothetical protein [Cysteiniphilum sp. 6C5]|uniref:hypothetical protein n=1 Tax=unclassified Cysteiniphilum TaxID=2610889 RepID=UPI003F83B3ED
MSNEKNESVNQVEKISNMPIPNHSFLPSEIQDGLKSMGLSGLYIDPSVLPTITLRNGHFLMSDDENFGEKMLDVKILQTSEKYILVDGNDPNFQDIKYSKDGMTTHDGLTVEEVEKMMLKAGRNPKLKRYLDILVQLVNRQDRYRNRFVVLSISPTSVASVSFALMEMGAQIKEYVVTVTKGMTRKSKQGHSYSLWALYVDPEKNKALFE